MKLFPVVGRITKDFELKTYNGVDVAKGVIAIPKEYVKEGEKDVSFVYMTCFGSTAKYLNKYASKGSRVFLKEWSVEQKITDDSMYYDFIIKSVEIIDYKESENI